MQADDDYAVFIDNSGSVSGRNHYWQVVGSIIKNKSIKRYFLWNDNVREVDYQDVKQRQACLRGSGGTDTVPVARKIVSQKLSNIILITDAEIDPEVVRKTDQVLENASLHNFHILNSICYVISHNYVYLNLSSICPFTRFGSSYVYFKRKGQEIKLQYVHESTDVKYIKDLSKINLRNFQFQIQKLERIIIKMNMGKSGAPAIREQLLALKKNLVYQLSVKKTEEDYSKEIRWCLEHQNTEAALEYAQKMTYEYMSYEYSMDIDRKINYLISLCGDLTTSFSVDEIQSNKMKYAGEAKEGHLDKEIPIEDLTFNKIQCPVIMDEDVPQILIDQGEPVLMGFDKKIVDDIAICPLRILNYPQVRAKFKSRLSQYTGVKLNGKIFKNPYTQRKLIGTIPLGTHQSHVEVGNYTIAQMVSDGKILGNLNLYYAVIWYLINQNQIQYLKPIKENAAEHLAFRLKNSHTNASMCGLPQFVTTRVSTDVAIWYIVNSGYFNLPTNRDVFRFHIFNMEPMVKILRVLKYPLHKGVKEHFFRTRAMLKMLFKLKKYNPNFQKGFHTIFKGFYQKGFFVDITNVSIDFWEREVCAMFIPIDGEADADQIKHTREIIPKCCKYLSNEQVYYLSTLLDESKSASDIALDYNAIIPPLPKAEINWCYGLNELKDLKVDICYGSMRPYLKINGRTWEDIARQTYKVEEVDQLFSGNRYFQRFVVKYKRFPISADQLAIFFYNRLIHSGKDRTLPYLAKKWTQEFIEQYQFVAFKKKNPRSMQHICDLFKIQNNYVRAGLEY